MVITHCRLSRRFQRDYSKLPEECPARVDRRLIELFRKPQPAGLLLEEPKRRPGSPIYAMRVTSEYKLSLSITGSTATLRRVASNEEIECAP